MPSVESVEQPASCRSAQEVAARSVVLYAVVGAGHKENRSEIVSWLVAEGLWDHVSPDERDFLECGEATQRQVVNATWRAEALFALLWSLRLFQDLPPPVALCDLQAMQSVLPAFLGPTATWIQLAQSRSAGEIEAANAEIYQTHWSVRDAQLFGRPVPNGYHPGIVQERHHALNWLVRYGNYDWDDVATDT